MSGISGAGRAESEDEHLRVEADLGFGADHLALRYRVAGHGRLETAVLLFDALYREDENGKVSHDVRRAYVTFEDPETLALKRVVPGLPRRKSVELETVPWAHRIERETATTGEILVALPAEESSPYYPAGNRGRFRTVPAREVKLVLGYIVLEAGLRAVPARGTAADAGFFQLEVEPEREPRATFREIRTSFALDAPIPVRRRVDLFEPV